MTHDELTTRLLALLRPHLAFLGSADELNLSSRLQDLGLDSAGAIGLLLDLEESFSIKFPDELLVPETFETPGAMHDAIRALL